MNKDSLRFFLIAAIGAAVVYFAFIRKPDHSNVPPRRVESAPSAENRLPERTFQVLTPLSGARAGLDVKVTTRSGAVRAIRLNGAQFTMPAAVPDPEDIGDENDKANARRALEYMGLSAGTPMPRPLKPNTTSSARFSSVASTSPFTRAA